MSRHTAATHFLESQGINFTTISYDYTPQKGHVGEQAAQAIGADARCVFKTLVVKLDGDKSAFAVIPVEKRVNFKILASVLGAKKAKMMQADEAHNRTGYLSGGTTPFGSRQAMAVVIDQSAFNHDKIWINAGAQGFLACLNPHDIQKITQALSAKIAA
ncbi:Cys-tRNA(Pro) deacylase [Aristophania vespae]|uniref:Cys-tRNA(Pro)/Cys-tRNA(Cys) deacylase n=1 Tax=Aristophania vespae TaxID=2697033 RepID=A0A6P1NF96_9PROT|nr:Cys-tRNA(Pro) deacylase [Aristophania vespae]QHI95983.1 Cys-tRNA(Pro) deacylase [Aristophania vespae]